MTQYWRAAPDEVDMIWAKVEDRIQAAMDRGGRYDAADVRDLLLKGDWQLWVGWHDEIVDCVALTTIMQHPKGTECIILAATGDRMENWAHHVESIEQWAMHLGCDRVRAVARPGWEKILTDYRKLHVELEKRL